MPVLESIKIGTRELTLHKMRTALTMLGVIFGVSAVISTSAIGAGARDELNRQLATLGTNTIRIRALELRGKELSDAQRSSPFGLTREDLANLRAVLPDLVAAAPLKTVDAMAASEGRVLTADVIGTNEDFPMISGHTVAAGRFLGLVDVEESRKVCVIGENVRQQAFPLEDALGQQLMIEGQGYTVIGVMAPRGVSSGATVIDVGDVDRSVYLPINAALRRLGRDDPRADKLGEVSLKLSGDLRLREAADLAERILLRRHNGIADFQVVVPEELIRQQQQTKSVLSSVLIFIAAISLLVGGIGIMNIMLASVTQRTREVGIRRALGATRRDILLQFLVESLLISLGGGLLGIAIGSGLAWGIGNYAKWPIIIPMEAIAISTSIAAIVGLVFGIYPSAKAAAIDPIEALRAE